MIPTTSEIKKGITVMNYTLLRFNLELCYDYTDETRDFYFDAAQAARLFKDAGLIDDFHVQGDIVTVKFDSTSDNISPEGLHDQRSKKHIMLFEDFSDHFIFSQYDAICIAASIERDRLLKEAAKAACEKAKQKVQVSY
jgi:hypothetical protein